MKNFYYEINPSSDCYKEIQQYYIEKDKWFSDEVKSEICKVLNARNLDGICLIASNLVVANPPNILIKQFKNKINRDLMYEAKLNSEISKEWRKLCSKYELKNINLSKIFEKYKFYPIASNDVLIKLDKYLLIKSARKLVGDFLIETEEEVYLEAKEKIERN